MMCCDGGEKKKPESSRGSVNFSNSRSSYFVNIGADIRSWYRIGAPLIQSEEEAVQEFLCNWEQEVVWGLI